MAASEIPSDVLRTHILPLLDGESLSTASCVSHDMRDLCNESKLWEDICNSKWPAVNDERVRNVMSNLPFGYRSLFKDCFPAIDQSNISRICGGPCTTELISAVVIRYKDDTIFSDVNVMETVGERFMNHIFWVEIETPAQPDSTGFASGNHDNLKTHLEENLRLDWILIDPARKTAGNFSSGKPVCVQKNWLTEDMQIRYITVLENIIRPSEQVTCKIEVTCGGKEGGGLHVREVMMQVQDMDRRCLTGDDSLVILQAAMTGGRRKKGGEKERYERYLEMREARWKREKRRHRRAEIVLKAIQLFILFGLLIVISMIVVS